MAMLRFFLQPSTTVSRLTLQKSCERETNLKSIWKHLWATFAGEVDPADLQKLCGIKFIAAMDEDINAANGITVVLNWLNGSIQVITTKT